MFKPSLLFCAFFLLMCNASASLKDSIKYYLNNKNPELIGGLSARNTFIGEKKTSVSGVAAGVDFGGKIRILAGVYGLLKPIEEKKTINKLTPFQSDVIEKSSFWYFGFTGVYSFYKKKKLNLEIPVRVGFGSAKVAYHDTLPNKNFISKNTSFVIPLETGIGAQYKIAWWIGLSGGLGSRIIIGKNIAQKFSGTYYNLGFNIFFSDIYYHIRNDMKQNPVNRASYRS